VRSVGVAFLASDRGDVDDAAVVPFHHVRHDRLAADEGPVEIDAQDLAPFLEVGFPYRLVDPGDAGVVDENVDLAESLERGVARLFDRGEIRHVDLERGDAGADFLCGLLGERLVMIPDRNLGAGGDKTLGDGAPKPLRAAGDDGAAAVQIDLVHDAIPLLRFVIGAAAAKSASSPRTSRGEGRGEGLFRPGIPRANSARCLAPHPETSLRVVSALSPPRAGRGEESTPSITASSRHR